MSSCEGAAKCCTSACNGRSQISLSLCLQLLWYRVTFIEYYTKYLAKAAALLAAQAPVSAMRLFDREHQNIHEIVRWASQGPPEEALPFYSDILWESMPLLSGRLDLLQREVFCKVRTIGVTCSCSKAISDEQVWRFEGRYMGPQAHRCCTHC